MRLFLILFILFSCNQAYQSPLNNMKKDTIIDLFIDINKQIILNEELKIDSILELSDYLFIKTAGGVRMWTDKMMSVSNSIIPQDGDIVTLLYECVELDDNLITLNKSIIDGYLSDTISFKLGFSKQMKGLNYAIKRLNVGDKAKIIIPSHLAFGVSGYGQQVSPYATLLLNVELLNCKK